MSNFLLFTVNPRNTVIAYVTMFLGVEYNRVQATPCRSILQNCK